MINLKHLYQEASAEWAEYTRAIEDHQRKCEDEGYDPGYSQKYRMWIERADRAEGRMIKIENLRSDLRNIGRWTFVDSLPL